MGKKKSTFFKDFKDFIAKGNVVDMAIGVVIGGAFGKITTSLVGDIINPLIGLLIGTENLATWAITIKEAVGDTPAVTLNIGNFLATILDFVIVAFAIFCVLRVLMNAKKAAEKFSKKDNNSESDGESSK